MLESEVDNVGILELVTKLSIESPPPVESSHVAKPLEFEVNTFPAAGVPYCNFIFFVISMIPFPLGDKIILLFDKLEIVLFENVKIFVVNEEPLNFKVEYPTKVLLPPLIWILLSSPTGLTPAIFHVETWLPFVLKNSLVFPESTGKINL